MAFLTVDRSPEPRSPTGAEANGLPLTQGSHHRPFPSHTGRFLSLLSISLQEEFWHSQGHGEHENGCHGVRKCSWKCNYDTGGSGCGSVFCWRHREKDLVYATPLAQTILQQKCQPQPLWGIAGCPRHTPLAGLGALP